MDTSPYKLPPHKSYPLGRLPPVSFLGAPRESPDSRGSLGREPATLTRKAHPVGEAGTKASLIAVRDAVLRGYVDPEVRAWAIKRLKDRGNPEDQVERARVLLTAIRDEKIWVPDPPNTEYVQEARLTLGEGPDKLVFHGGDCDDLSVATLSAYLSIAGSVGCYAAVVGHSYARDGQLSHVLGAILAPGPDGERWYYVEPSSKKVPFGESYEPTREVVYIVPGTTGDQPDCDAARCLAGSRAVRPPQQKPQFFGVSAPPPAGPSDDGGTLGAPGDVIPGPDGGDPSVMPVPSPIGENDKIGQWLLATRNNLAASRENLLKDYDALSQVADAFGRPLPSPDAPNVFQTPAGGTPGAVDEPWTAEDSAYVRTLTTASDQLLRMMDRILLGYQPLVWVESLKNFGMRYEPEDRYEVTIQNDRVVLKDRGTSAVAGPPPPAVLADGGTATAPILSGTAIAVIIVLAILGVAVVATTVFVAKINDRQAAKASTEANRRLLDAYERCLSSPNCTPAQRELLGRAFGVQTGALSPAAVPQPGAYGTGEGFGWSWLAWPLIGATVIAFLFSTEKVYTRQSNRSRRFQQRAAREAAKTAAAQKTAKGGRYVYGQVIGTRPDGTPIIEATDAQPTPSWGQRVAGAVLGL